MPDQASLFEAATAYHVNGRLAEAEKLYRALLERNPAHHEALHRLGLLAYQCGDSASAEKLLGGAIALKPDTASYHNHLGLVLQALGRSDEARASFSRAIELAPRLAEAHNNLGNLLLDADETDAAIACFQRARALAPGEAEIAFNLGNAWRKLGRTTDADAAYSAAIALKPDHVEAHVNRGLVLLSAGRFADGGAEYDWRWRLRPPPSPLRTFEAAEWDGTPLPHGTVLIHVEQGLGDTIQFARFVIAASERCRHVLFEVPPSLKRLLAPLEKYAELVCRGDLLPPFDAHCPLLSLPWRIGIEKDHLARAVPYLAAESGRVSRWRPLLPEGFRVGLAWQGNPAAKHDRHRSIPLAAFAPLAEIPGIRLICLQKEPDGTLPTLIYMGAEFDAGPDAFLDTAAVMASLDLVVTSDTAIAHLAGALGRPVWVVLGKSPDWRWQLDSGETSPWYTSTRLFRQSIAGDWTEPLAQAAEILRRQTGARR